VVLGREALAVLEASAWPGNVRELDHVLARGVLRAAARGPKGAPVQIEPGDLDLAAAPAARRRTSPLAERVARGRLPLREAIDELKRASIAGALEETGGNWAEAARRLGMDRGNLHHMAQRLGVRPGGSVSTPGALER